jgi:hypothetical protein
MWIVAWVKYGDVQSKVFRTASEAESFFDQLDCNVKKITYERDLGDTML